MILIHPYAQKLRNGMPNPKTYPYWRELLALMSADSRGEGDQIVQLAVEGEDKLVDDVRVALSLKEITRLLVQCECWIAVDSFLPHLAHHIPRPGVVLWSKSDPKHFGYSENLNLLKDRKYLRKQQFQIWEQESYDPDAFMPAREVYKAIREWVVPPRLSAVVSA